MKKFMLTTALAAACLCLASCEEEQKEKVTPAALLSLSFTAENNPDVLQRDVTVANPQPGIVRIELPVGTSSELMASMVPSFETSEEEAVVLINGTEVISGKSVCDFSNDADLYVTYKGVTTSYIISVFSKEGLTMNLLAEGADSTFNNGPEIAINPEDNKIYIISSMPNEGDQKKFALGYVVDESGIKPMIGNSPVFADVTISEYSIKVSEDGNVFVSFNENAKNMSVASVSNGFSYIGEAASLPKAGSAAALVPAASNDIWIGYQLAAATNGLARRTLELAHWTAAWETEIAITPERPAGAYAYTCKSLYANGSWYMYIYNQNQQDVSLYVLNDKKWETVFESMKIKKLDGSDSEKLYTTVVDFDIASNGDVYILAGPQYDGTNYAPAVVRYRPETGEQTFIGGVLTDVALATSGSYDMALDSFDTPYFIYSKDGGIYMTYIDNKTKLWAAASVVADSVTKAGIEFGENGDAYVYGRNKSGHVVLYSSKN